MANETFEIPLSRITLFIFFIAGAFLLWAGLEIGFLHRIIGPFDVAPGRLWAYYGFLVFFIVVGGACFLRSLLYLLRPPALLRASAEGIAFATGLRYRPFMIPWRFVDTIGVGIDLSQLPSSKIQGGLQISFVNSNEIPNGLPTSIGVSYMFYTLTVRLTYMGRSMKESVEALRKMQEQYRG
ncbi:MAG: hypothetical protein JXA20_13050 [Spirochaetes bacterium]|nr:hypothetical protein [Spirochaetota bacterium]